MIRFALPEDATRVAQLLRESFEVELRPYLALTQHGVAAYLAQQLTHRWSYGEKRFVVAESAGDVVAFAELGRLDDDTAFIAYICVAPEHRGRGLARSLLAYSLRRDSPFSRVALDVFAHNSIALRLYRGLGFKHSSSSMWLRRALPTARGDLRASDLHVTTACLDAYGFANLRVLDEAVSSVGLIGNEVVRLPTLASFSDDTLLARIADALPERRQALAIVPKDNLSGEFASDQTAGVDIILESHRLVASIDHVLNALERNSESPNSKNR